MTVGNGLISNAVEYKEAFKSFQFIMQVAQDDCPQLHGKN